MLKISMSNRFQFRMMPEFRGLLWPQKGGDIHYIGGAEILPAPFTIDEEKKILDKLGGSEDQAARSCLIEHNLRLVVYIAKKFDNTGVGVEDLISIGTIGLIKAINTFNPLKNIRLGNAHNIRNLFLGALFAIICVNAEPHFNYYPFTLTKLIKRHSKKPPVNFILKVF